ncbi:hypothetical protein LTR62_006477 [Meristemomyces frigidus]|uniref:BTB domain-containing protein n=1 Tax=Meristemomyces frigidus TaxID=1508187 RepID=A0AAN7YPV2_9PEZI|nr:hypothetical protein LTR62_006477 [Meristemomyces frigidus]
MSVPTAAAQFRDYFAQSTYSDILVKLSDGQSFPAHRLVLAQGSQYFAKCFEGGFKEAQSNVLELHDDVDVSAVFVLISTFYGHAAYDLFAYGKEDAKRVTLAIDVGTTAAKYLCSEVYCQVLTDFPDMLEALQSSVADIETLGKIVRHVYVVREETAVAFREVIVVHIARYIAEWKAGTGFKDLLREIPDLALELVVELAQHKEASSAMRVASEGGSVAKKRRHNRG